MDTRAETKNFRRNDNDDDDDTPSISTNLQSLFKSATTLNAINQAPKLLSFPDDDDNDVEISSCVPSKPSSLSHKITSSKDRIIPSFSPRFTVQPQAGTYTKEALLELQKCTINLAYTSKPFGSKPMFITNGLINRVGSISNVSKEVDEEKLESTVMRNRADTQLLIASMGIVNVKDDYPDQETNIASTRKKGKLRQFDGGSNHDTVEGSSDGKPEFPGLISIVGNEDVNERRVGSPIQDMPAPPSIQGSFRASQGFSEISIAQQAEIARKSIQENVRRLKESHGRSMSSLNKTEANLTASLLNITDLEKSLSDAVEKFVSMQKLRDLVSSICDFLQHKAPFIIELEERMQKIHEEHASAIIERRVADNHDEMMEIEAAVNAAVSVLSKGDGSAAMVAAATSAACDAVTAVKEKINLQERLDDSSGDVNIPKRMDMQRRAEARKRRKTRSDSKRMSSLGTNRSYQRIDGEPSTDESDSETNAYQSNCEMLLQAAYLIFSEDFSQLSVVKERFDSWKKYYSSSYQDAYTSLSIPSIFSLYVRLDLLKWDPVRVQQDFINMEWHSLLFDYGLTEDRFNREDGDASLVPQLVEEIALPILHHEIVHCWDVLSNKKTANAVAATQMVASYEVSEPAFEKLLAAIHIRLSEAVTTISVPVWSPLVMKAVPNAGRIAAYRFGTSVRLMRNICLWKDILSDAILEKLALDELLCGKILPHVRAIKSNIHDAITRTERIIASLSGMWTGKSVDAHRRCKVPSLVEFVQILGKSLQEKQRWDISESEMSGLARRVKKMFVDLNEYDESEENVFWP